MPKEIAGLTIYTLKEISTILKVTINTLRSYIKKKKLKAKKVGKEWHITDEALREYFSRQQSGKEKKKKR